MACLLIFQTSYCRISVVSENSVLFQLTKSIDDSGMIAEIPNESILLAGGAFLIGWVLASAYSSLRARFRVKKRDSRDDRIRELEAELRIAATEQDKLSGKIERLNEELKANLASAETRDSVISKQQSKIDQMASDLKESVIKTRELRAELTERAAENVQAEVKLREVETELSVAHASTDMISTGILDYTTETDNVGADNTTDTDQAAVRTKRSDVYS